MAQLNDLTLRNLPIPAAGRVQYADGKIPGFGIRVSARGSKVFYLTYRFQGQNRRLILGRYPATKLAEARAKAHGALAQIKQNQDPQKAANGTAGTDDAAPLSFAAALDQFVKVYCAHHNKPSTAAETERILRSVFLPEWKNRSLASIAKADVLSVLDDILARGAPSAAVHAYAVIRKFFSWCFERSLVAANPCQNLKPPAKKNARDRVLSDAELVTLWRASAKQGFPFGTIFQLLCLTGQRRSEVAGMRWSEIDPLHKTWTIPGDRSKNGKPHTIPLTPRVRAILQSLPKFETDLVFPARGLPEQPYSGFSKGKRSLDTEASLHNWTLHDLRRTAATGMARLGVPPHVVEKILNHTTGTFAGVAGVYNRFEYRQEMKEGLRLWNAHLKTCIKKAEFAEK